MKTSKSDGLPYIKFCNEVMNNPELLKNFRRNPDYDLVVPGNRKGEEVLEFVKLICDEYPEMLSYMPVFEKNQGVFGNPTTHKFDFNGRVYNLDVPMPLHIFYLALTIKYFGNLNGLRICEIGAGAGLFFKILTDLYPDVRYTFVDLPAPLFILRKHVEYLGREKNVEYVSCNQIMDGYSNKYDLVVSDCAFNELHKDVQEIYIERILNNSKRGRIAFYDDKTMPNLNIVQVLQVLKSKTKIIKMDLRVPSLYWGETHAIQ